MTDSIYRNWNLIQRLERREAAVRPIADRNRTGHTKTGLLVKHDYMGSAEFEWGAVPATWKRLRGYATTNKLVRLETPFLSNKGEPFYVICHVDDVQTYVFDGILGAGTDAYRTKESTYMRETMAQGYASNPGHYTQRCIGWLVLSDPERHSHRNLRPVLWLKDKDIADALWDELAVVYDTQE